jgi:hypothetical protein
MTEFFPQFVRVEGRVLQGVGDDIEAGGEMA